MDKCQENLSLPAEDPKMMFIDSPAGGGKTFLLNLILSMSRGQGKIALACASTGIASMLLVGGTTAHSRFGIPVPVNDESISTIRVTTERAEVIRQAVIIIWDEITTHASLFVCSSDIYFFLFFLPPFLTKMWVQEHHIKLQSCMSSWQISTLWSVPIACAGRSWRWRTQTWSARRSEARWSSSQVIGDSYFRLLFAGVEHKL